METDEGFILVNSSDCIDPLIEVTKDLEETKTELLQLQKTHGDLTAECSELKKQSQRLLSEREDLTHRLSKEMSNKVASDESSVENISIKNRPMVVAEEYERLFSEEWLDAKTMLDSKTSLEEEKKISLLCDILLVALTNVKTKYAQRLDEFQQNFSHPLRNSASQKITRNTGVVPISGKRTIDTADKSMSVDPDQLTQTELAKYEISDSEQLQSEQPKGSKPEACIMNEIGDYYRKTADTVDLKSIISNISILISNRMVFDGWVSLVKGEAPLQDYIQACARIAWKMVIQRPSMTCQLKGIGEKWNAVTQEVAYGSDDPTHDLARVKLYQYPALYHGDRLMTKGKVIVKIQ